MTDQEKGICCRGCGCRHLYVVKTGPAPRGRIMRKRECRNCGQVLVTYEAAAGELKPQALSMEDLSASQRETLLRKLLGLIGLG